MSRRPLLLLPLLLLGLVLALGGLSRSLVLPPTPDAAPCPPEARVLHRVVALGGGRALHVQDADQEPLRVEHVTARGEDLVGGWRWSGGPGVREWRRRGPLVVGSHHDRSTCEDRLELLDADRGHLASLSLASGWCFAGGGVAALLSSTADGTADLALVTTAGTSRLARLPADLRLEATASHVIGWGRRRAWAVELGTGALTELAELGDPVGAADGVLLTLRDGRLVTRPLRGGLSWTIDLAGGAPLLDGTRFVPPRPPGASPRLVGCHAGAWIVSYATETHTDARTNDEGWRTPATQHLAAVAAATGEVLWRRTLGAFELAEPGSADAPLAPDHLVLGWTEDEAHERTFWLGSVALADGALRWSTTWPARGHALEPRLLRRGDRSYLLAPGLDCAGLAARFEGGRLTGALGCDVDALGLDGDEEWAAPCGVPRRSPLDDAAQRARCAERLRLPPAARAP